MCVRRIRCKDGVVPKGFGREQTICARYKAGATPQQILQEFQVGHEELYEILDYYDIPLRIGCRWMSRMAGYRSDDPNPQFRKTGNIGARTPKTPKKCE